MAGVGILARSELRVMIKNSYLNANAKTAGKSADIDLVTLSPHDAFEFLNSSQGRGIPKSGALAGFDARGITINGAVDDKESNVTDRNATFGFINGREKNEPENYYMEEKFVSGVMHPNGFRYIRPRGTTARGIIIHS